MRVLIISPHFPPANTADLHRVRLLLPYFVMYGWKAEVLAVDPGQVASPQDQWLEAGLPANIPIHRVQAMGLGWARLPGLGTLGFRAMRALAQRGDDLLHKGDFDLVYFSTTVFEVHILGPRWKKKYGVPFMMDYQDPWVNDYYREHPAIIPPGGRLKYAVIDRIHRFMEPGVLRVCAGITSVSPAYPREIQQRYPWSFSIPLLEIPFPGDARDLERATTDQTIQTVFTTNDGCIHWVYCGAVIPAMFRTLRALFKAVASQADEPFRSRLKIHFVGTRYGPANTAKAIVTPLVEEFGLENTVFEHPARIPYSETMACLQQADALLVLGSDDPAYTASKIYPYLLAYKPLLTVFHESSQVVDLIEKVGGSVCIAFNDSMDTEQLADAISSKWFAQSQYQMATPLDKTAFAPYMAKDQTRRLCAFFSELLVDHAE